MNRKIALALILLVTTPIPTALVIMPVDAQTASGDWPMFQANPAHTAAVTSSPALTPTLLWNYTLSESGDSPVVANGSVYIGDPSRFYAVNAATGTLQWNYLGGVSSFSVVSSCAAVANGVVYVDSGETLYAMNASDGSQLWNYTIPWGGTYFASAPTVDNGIVYASSYGTFPSTIYAFNATDGAQLWSWSYNVNGYLSPAIANGIAYFGMASTSPFVYEGVSLLTAGVYAVNATNGAVIWSYTNSNYTYGMPSVADGVVYIHSFTAPPLINQISGGPFFALNATNGNELWNYSIGGLGAFSAVSGGAVYVASGNSVYALNADSGTLIWNYTIGSTDSSPAVVGGVIYVSGSNKLYALNANSGALLWGFTADGALSSPAIANGVIYDNSPDNLYALGTPTPSPSPMLASSPNANPSALSNGALLTVVASIVVVITVATVTFLVLRKRLSTKRTSELGEVYR